MKNILVTGGAGFIGSNFLLYFINKYKAYNVINLDSLTYAGNLENLRSIESSKNYKFIRGSITDADLVDKIIKENKIDTVINFAAETHVDRSILGAKVFLETNVLGTMILLECAKKYQPQIERYLQVSTDEVYGSLGQEGYFTEETPSAPNSPYSSSKASADMFVRAYNHTFGVPTLITRCSNNYGPYQFPEKLIPLMINNCLEGKPLPVYGKGENVRDWLYVEDHGIAIDEVLHKGSLSEVYNIGGNNEWKNIDIVNLVCELMEKKLNKKPGTLKSLIDYVKDRPGHDLRYAIDSSKIKNKLGWDPKTTFEKGIDLTIDWYLSNRIWLKNITNGSYKEYYKTHYDNREKTF